jgi:hypothetical protein
MAYQAHTRSDGAYVPTPILLKILSIILFSIVIVLGIASRTSRVALAIQPQLNEVPHRLPGRETWSARYQEQAGINAGQETGGQQVLEAWSTRYQRQADAYAAQQASLERGRQAWSARYQFQ